jgi:hypothetical protein
LSVVGLLSESGLLIVLLLRKNKLLTVSLVKIVVSLVKVVVSLNKVVVSLVVIVSLIVVVCLVVVVVCLVVVIVCLIEHLLLTTKVSVLIVVSSYSSRRATIEVSLAS